MRALYSGSGHCLPNGMESGRVIWVERGKQLCPHSCAHICVPEEGPSKGPQQTQILPKQVHLIDRK